MAHREFKLINSLGQEFDLLRKDAVFISPSGLGRGIVLNTTRAGSFYVATETYTEQATITGTIAFKGYEPYKEYVEFIRYTPIVMCYKPLDTWYKRDVVNTQISKGEIDKDGIRLYSDVDFVCSAGWYINKSSTATIGTIEAENPKVYPYSYDYTYYGSATGTTKLDIANDGTPMKVTFFGPVKNPEVVVYNAGNRVGAGRFVCELTANEALVVDSNPLTIQASVVDKSTGAFKRNAYQYGDISTERFIYLPKGINTFAIGCYGTTDGFTALIEVKDYADTV